MGRKTLELQKIEFNPHMRITLEECIEQHKKLVYLAANQLTRSGRGVGYEYDDLVSVGFIGLIQAYSRFDPTRFKGAFGGELRFSTYAFPAIRGEILRTLRDVNPGPKFSRAVKEFAYKINKQKLGDKTAKEISEILGITEVHAASCLEFLRDKYAMSTQTVVRQEGSKVHQTLTLEQIIEARVDPSETDVNMFLASLPVKYKTVAKMRMEGYTQKEIGPVIGVNQVQVSRIQEKLASIIRLWLDGEDYSHLVPRPGSTKSECGVRKLRGVVEPGRTRASRDKKVYRCVSCGTVLETKAKRCVDCRNKRSLKVDLQEKETVTA